MKIVDILGNEVEFNCMGCDIAEHRMLPPGGYVYEDNFINVSADPEIPIPGFMVLGINKHIKSLNELSKEERYQIIDILNLTITKIKECKISDEVLLIQEERANHFHIWVVPTYDWMKVFNKNVRNIDKIIEYAKTNYNDKVKDNILQCVEILKKSFKES